jgi:TatD DNase family protein
MTLIDTHCHLYSEELQQDIHQVIERAQSIGVQRFYLPAIDSNSHNAMLALEEKYPSICIPMMGLHPCYVKENFKEELALVEQWLNNKKFVAIGEIGLDFYWDTTFSKQQYEAFELQMYWALQHNLPIVIHTRNAMQEAISIVKPFAEKGLKGIFHCFGDNIETANQIIDLGFLMGIGGVLTYKKSGLDETLKHVDLKHLVLETDAPYLTPVPFRGKRNESSYLEYIVQRLAEIKNLPVQEVAAITTANAEKIFGG